MEHMSTVFSQARQDAEAFTALLDLEHQALVDRDMTALEALLADKAPLITALSQHDQSISSYCQQMGVAAGESLEHHLSQHASASLLADYRSFKDALQQCQHANDRNARLVRHNQQATGQLLDLLRNQGESSQHVYDNHGLASRSANPRNLTKA